MSGCVPPGTVVRVEDLFYNVPARLKFLKQDTTERNLINALISRYAIAYPEMRFRLIHDGKVFLQTYGHGDRREILATYYGVDVARQMLEVILEESDVSIQGFTSLSRLPVLIAEISPSLSMGVGFKTRH